MKNALYLAIGALIFFNLSQIYFLVRANLQEKKSIEALRKTILEKRKQREKQVALVKKCEGRNAERRDWIYSENKSCEIQLRQKLKERQPVESVEDVIIIT